MLQVGTLMLLLRRPLHRTRSILLAVALGAAILGGLTLAWSAVDGSVRPKVALSAPTSPRNTAPAEIARICRPPLFAFEMRDPIGNAAAPRTKPRCRSSRAKGADIVVLGEQHLREALLPYMRYCNETRRAADQI